MDNCADYRPSSMHDHENCSATLMQWVFFTRFQRNGSYTSARPDWQAEALCSQPVRLFVRSSVRPFIRLPPNL